MGVRRGSALLVIGASALAMIVGCTHGDAAPSETTSTARESRFAASSSPMDACALVSRAEMEALVGARFAETPLAGTKANRGSTCRYDPPDGHLAPRIVLGIVREADIATAKARMAGAKVDVRLATKMSGVPASEGMPGMQPGPITGLGDEATVMMNQLHVRKGAVLIDIQAFLIDDPMKMMTDTAANAHQLEKMKAIAGRMLEKL